MADTNTYGLHSTVAALNALQVKLRTIQWGGKPAFERVEFFDLSDLLKALQELLRYGSRVCLIIHARERFDNTRSGLELHTRKTNEVTLLMADKNLKDRRIALLGDDTTPGVLALDDLVLNSLTGLLMAGVFIQPVTGEQMLLTQKERDELTGRVAFTLSLELSGGNVIKNLGRQPIP